MLETLQNIFGNQNDLSRFYLALFAFCLTLLIVTLNQWANNSRERRKLKIEKWEELNVNFELVYEQTKQVFSRINKQIPRVNAKFVEHLDSSNSLSAVEREDTFEQILFQECGQEWIDECISQLRELQKSYNQVAMIDNIHFLGKVSEKCLSGTEFTSYETLVKSIDILLFFEAAEGGSSKSASFDYIRYLHFARQKVSNLVASEIYRENTSWIRRAFNQVNKRSEKFKKLLIVIFDVLWLILILTALTLLLRKLII